MLYRYLLVVRFALVNLVAAALLVATYMQGWLDGVFAERLREMSGGIFLVFLYGLAVCGARVWQHSVELNELKAGTPDPESRAGQYLSRAPGASPESRILQAGTLRLKLTNRIVVVRHIANALVFLGLIGTVIGFIIALSGIDPESASSAENVAAMVTTLIGGMSDGQCISTMTLPGALWSSVCFLAGTTCGNSMTTMATNPIRVSRMTSRKTVPQASSSSSSSSCTGLSKLDGGGNQIDRAGDQNPVADD